MKSGKERQRRRQKNKYRKGKTEERGRINVDGKYRTEMEGDICT